MRPKQIVAIVLAAGQASRMGRIKQLLKHQNKTLVQTVMDKISKLGMPMIVVLGAYHDQIAENIKDHKAVIVINPNWKQGIGTSISYGLSAATDRFDELQAVMIVLADQPGITEEHFVNLMKKGLTSGKMVATKYRDTLGVPAYFPKQYFDALKALTGDHGAKSLFMKKPDQVQYIVCEAAALDIDTEQDWLDYVKPSSSIDF
jgi:molybdenum cofactor cytidylyltransferase